MPSFGLGPEDAEMSKTQPGCVQSQGEATVIKANNYNKILMPIIVVWTLQC